MRSLLSSYANLAHGVIMKPRSWVSDKCAFWCKDSVQYLHANLIPSHLIRSARRLPGGRTLTAVYSALGTTVPYRPIGARISFFARVADTSFLERTLKSRSGSLDIRKHSLLAWCIPGTASVDFAIVALVQQCPRSLLQQMYRTTDHRCRCELRG